MGHDDAAVALLWSPMKCAIGIRPLKRHANLSTRASPFPNDISSQGSALPRYYLVDDHFSGTSVLLGAFASVVETGVKIRLGIPDAVALMAGALL
jgi:hypothetical protein